MTRRVMNERKAKSHLSSSPSRISSLVRRFLPDVPGPLAPPFVAGDDSEDVPRRARPPAFLTRSLSQALVWSNTSRPSTSAARGEAGSGERASASISPLQGSSDERREGPALAGSAGGTVSGEEIARSKREVDGEKGMLVGERWELSQAVRPSPRGLDG